MTRVGITGHSNITGETAELVRVEMSNVISQYAKLDDAGLIGITCLGRGADQVFAEVVLSLKGQLEVVVPSKDYDQIPDPKSSARYQRLLRQAVSVREMPFETAGPEAYFAATKELIQASEIILAVWDGGPPDGRGGTADAVNFARQAGREIVVIWPTGAARG
jgi:hypothetical protein